MLIDLAGVIFSKDSLMSEERYGSGLTELLEYVCARGLLVVEGSHVEHAIVYCKLSKSHGRQSVTGHLHGPTTPARGWWGHASRLVCTLLDSISILKKHH